MSYRGEAVYRGTVTGCLADRVVVSEKAALPVRSVPLDQAALLGCAALTGVGAALHAVPVREGASVLVVGAGGVGQFVAQGARIAGAETILVSDPFPARRERALALGATVAVAPEEVEVAVAATAPEGVDLAFDCVGDPETVATALRHTRDGGTAVAVGLPPAGLRFEVEPFELIRREKRLTGTLYGSVDPAKVLPELLEHVAAGRLELEPLVGDRFGLDEIDDAVAASLAGSGARVLVTFP
jgi:S-(hydroxymethyl)glutathione dehydrogenase/alcohol dehydrogenase